MKRPKPMIHAVLVTAALALSGCLATGAAPRASIEPSTVGSQPAAVGPSPEVCVEAQGDVLGTESDFPESAIPPGFKVIYDETGRATIVTIPRSCEDGEADSMLVF